MSRVNLLKKIKVDGRWVLRSIPKRANGNWDWGALHLTAPPEDPLLR